MDDLKMKFMDLIRQQVYTLVIRILSFCEAYNHTFSFQKNSDIIPIINYENDPVSSFDSPVKKALENTTINDTDMKMEEEISSDYDILDSIDSIYFTEDFNPSRRELEVLFVTLISAEIHLMCPSQSAYCFQKLDDILQVDVIENNLHRLQAQLAVVSKRVLHMILENQSLCQKEFIK